jgi:hypothetical protein
VTRLRRKPSRDHERSTLCGRERSEMRTRARMANPAECGLRPFDHRMNRPEPKAWWAATLTAEKRAHVCQDGIRHVEYRLKWSESKYGDGETPGEPFGVGQIPQNLRNGFSSELPSWVKLEVWKRDQGRCQKCGTSSGLHFDHIIPLFEGWVVVGRDESCDQVACARPPSQNPPSGFPATGSPGCSR